MKRIVEAPQERRKPFPLSKETRKILSFWAPKTLALLEKRNADIQLWSMKPASPLAQ